MADVRGVRTERLKEVLERINRGENPEKVRKEAKDLIENIDAVELSLAEQKLIEEGTRPEELRGLCTIHMEMLKGELEKLKAKVSPGHVLHTLISEHDEILKFLDMLEDLNFRIQKMERFDAKSPDFPKLAHVAKHLVEAELHHRREEDVLFPELEKRGITGPPRIMRMEHYELRGKKKRLLELANAVSTMNFEEFKKELDEVTKFIIFNLRDHIFKENYILYPTALESLKDEALWENMRKTCDEIGYCCFTPKEARQPGL